MQNAAWRATGSVASLTTAGQTKSVISLSAESACPGYQQATIDLARSGETSEYNLMIASNSWDHPSEFPIGSDAWRYDLDISRANATGRLLRKCVNGSWTTISSIAGPGAQATWAMRIKQDVDEATKKIACYDGATVGSLAEQITTNDTANSDVDNIYVNIRGYMGGGTTTITFDNFELVTP